MRTRNPIIVLGPDGRPLAGAQVYTRVRPSGADATVYAAETGAALGANPATSDAQGRVVQWLERGAYSSTVTAAGMDPYVEEWESTPGSDRGIDGPWIGDSAFDLLVPLGVMVPYAGDGDPPGGRFLLCDGRQVNSADYPKLDALIGAAAPAGKQHKYSGGASPGAGKFRLPDKRGRVSVGADNMGTGAANRLPSSNNVAGQNGGAEQHNHRTPWPFVENGGAGNFVGAIMASSAGFLSRLGISLRNTGANVTSGVGGISKLNGGASSHPELEDAPFNDAAVVYDTTTGNGSTLQPYEVDNWIIRVA